jgi:signal peptidase I
MTFIAPVPDEAGPTDPPPVPDDAGGKPPRSETWVLITLALEWFLVIAGALAIAFTIRATTFQVFYIPSGSMEPTLAIGDRVVVNQWSYRLHDVHRGDIVVFSRPPGESASEVKDLIKRVVGLPGESVTIADNHVRIDGEVLDEPYLPQGTLIAGTGTPHSCEPTSPCVIPDGDVWVMGDNRTNSRDSRYFGPIKESSIVGRAFVRLWPLSRLGGL